MAFTTIYNNPYHRAIVTPAWVYWDDAFTAEELEKIVLYCEQFELSFGTVQGSESLSVEEAQRIAELHRISDVKFHERNSDTAWIFDRLNTIIQAANEMYYGFDLNGYDKFQYTTYESSKRAHYDWHMDLNTAEDQKEMTRKLSLTLCLNDTYEGGLFQINDGKENKAMNVPTKKGRMIIFPSFMIHKVTPITKGTRRSLVVWTLGPKFR